jgi:hypothetical protein
MTDYPSFDDSKFDRASGGRRIVYVRPVRTADLPGEVQAQIEGNLGRTTVYAIHAPTGEVLALVPDRNRAFLVARQNEFAPVSVH